MRCAKCEAENPDNARFCVECAAPFAQRCPSCHAENPASAKFCSQCASALNAGAPARPRPPSQTHPRGTSDIRVTANTGGDVDTSIDGERKTVTALFADINGSMELMEDIDPEEARAIFDPAHGLATARILLLVNYRPEYHHQWCNKTYYTQLRLDPLGTESADEMLAALLAAPALAAEAAGASRERPTVRSEAEDGRVRAQEGITALKHLVIERTAGNPFFMEEMVQALFEQGVLVRRSCGRGEARKAGMTFRQPYFTRSASLSSWAGAVGPGRIQDSRPRVAVVLN